MCSNVTRREAGRRFLTQYSTNLVGCESSVTSKFHDGECDGSGVVFRQRERSPVSTLTHECINHVPITRRRTFALTIVISPYIRKSRYGHNRRSVIAPVPTSRSNRQRKSRPYYLLTAESTEFRCRARRSNLQDRSPVPLF